MARTESGQSKIETKAGGGAGDEEVEGVRHDTRGLWTVYRDLKETSMKMKGSGTVVDDGVAAAVAM